MATTLKIVSGDIVESKITGRPVLISGKGKLSQDLSEMLTIATQPNGFGAGLESLRGVLSGGDLDLSLAISRRISNATAAFAQLQKDNQRLQRSDAEVLSGLTVLKVEQTKNKPTDYKYLAGFQSVEGQLKIGGLITLRL